MRIRINLKASHTFHHLFECGLCYPLSVLFVSTLDGLFASSINVFHDHNLQETYKQPIPEKACVPPWSTSHHLGRHCHRSGGLLCGRQLAPRPLSCIAAPPRHAQCFAGTPRTYHPTAARSLPARKRSSRHREGASKRRDSTSSLSGANRLPQIHAYTQGLLA